MDVEKYIAYRIVRETEGQRPDYKRGQVIDIHQYMDHSFNEIKKEVEDAFEVFRLSYANSFPSRKKALYVFPYDPEPLSRFYEDYWLEQKFHHDSQGYIRLTLSLTGRLFWFDAYHFEKYAETVIPELIMVNRWSQDDIATIQNSCLKSYWRHIRESEFTEDMLIEGLFVGDAVVVDVENKEYNRR